MVNITLPDFIKRQVELEEAVTGSVGQVNSGEEVAKTVVSVQVCGFYYYQTK